MIALISSSDNATNTKHSLLDGKAKAFITICPHLISYSPTENVLVRSLELLARKKKMKKDKSK
ncbi:putative cAMP and cAMP-inhibited cGMP 3,5-cyclic phosphodiesterase [Sesbania bispinosa]|nr:putative cAMP and cAMP-inhibited cGMP 3,5-cyclic phosphodiesterase [Sesbania bispinosa]